MFGCVPRLPIDSILSTYNSATPSQSKSSNVETWEDQIKKAEQIAFQHCTEIKTKILLEEILKKHT